MSTQMNQYQPFFAYLQSLNFHFLETWVIECVNYYKTNNPGISLEVLKNEVKQQWLLVNLREIKVPSLPPDLKSKEHIVLNGMYAVQVESMIDSSESCYSQFQKLLKINTENMEVTSDYPEWNNKSIRCLTFDICDGVQELQAMEYQPIKKIRQNDPELLPGFKMVIIGPVECRKGMFLLKEENVRICGGEVDTLVASNNLKSILIKRLELDEADYLDTSSSNQVEDETEVPPVMSSVNDGESGGNLNESCVETLLSQNDELFLTLPLETEILKEELKPKETVNTINNTEFDMFSESPVEWNENGLSQYNNTTKYKKHSLPEEDIATSTQKRLSLDPELENIETEPTKWNLSVSAATNSDNGFQSQLKTSTRISQTKNSVQTKLFSFFKSDESVVSSVSRISNDSETQITVSGKPFVYLKHILSTHLNKFNVFTIKGIILTLRNKITIENDEFSLKVNVTDGSGSVDADFSSKILENFLGFSPSEMIVMMKAKQGNSAIAQRIKDSFIKTQEKLISLNCLMKIKFFKDGKSPLILSLEDLTIDHLKELKERRKKNSF